MPVPTTLSREFSGITSFPVDFLFGIGYTAIKRFITILFNHESDIRLKG